MLVDVFPGKSRPAGRTESFTSKAPLPPPEHRSDRCVLRVLRVRESQQEEASGPSSAILVTSVNSPIVRSDVISTFDMVVFL